MDWTQLNIWLSLLANLGVIAGLVLVAIQIRQNTGITRAQVTNDWYMADMQLELAMMGEDPAASWTKAGRTVSAISSGTSATRWGIVGGSTSGQVSPPISLRW